MTDFSVTGFDPHTGQMSSETFAVMVDRVAYSVERWVSGNASGEEWTDATGEPVDVPYDTETPDEQDIFDEALENFSREFSRRYHDEVYPIIQRITREAIAAAAARSEEK